MGVFICISGLGLVRDAMEHAGDLAVPLDVSTGIGSDWQLAAH